ncbi:MAG: hypothetical protein ACTSSP_00255 [Candidatus Asgardarchaeia archaeon]
MKIRIGFVSNSSTSSFVLAGFNLGQEKVLYEQIYTSITGKTEEYITTKMKESKGYKDDSDDPEYREEYVREYLWNEIQPEIAIQSGSESGVGDKTVVGRMLVWSGSDGDYWDNIEVDMDKLSKELEPLRQILGTDSELKLFIGSACC